MKEDLGFGHMGNGITFWDRKREEHRDYKKVAHIGYVREVTYYDKKLSDGAKAEIESFAKLENSCASVTQAYPVLKPIRFTDMKVAELAVTLYNKNQSPGFKSGLFFYTN